MSDIGIFLITVSCLRRGYLAGLRADQAEGGIVIDADTGTVLYGKEHPHCLLPGQYHEDHDSPGGD